VLRSLKELYGYEVRGTDGDIGKVHDFFFDDLIWTVRYLVVETGSWLSGRRVLLSTMPLGRPQWEKRSFPVLLSREKVRSSPDIDAHKPVSRKMEEALHSHYGWPTYWRTAAPIGGVGAFAIADIVTGEVPKRDTTQEADSEGSPQDWHLRSTREVLGYGIQAQDGEVGRVDDFVGDDVNWAIRYLVVDTRKWLPGRKVLVAPTWLEEVAWVSKKVHVDLPRDVIKGSPEFDRSAPVNREYEVRLYDYYGRPKYWVQK
jgi:hypothetical protein